MNATLINRSLSLIIGIVHIGYIAGQYGFDRVSLVYSIAIIAIVCMIWFGDAIGEFSAYFIRRNIVNTEMPGKIACFMGWLFLCGNPIVAYLVQ